MKFFIKKKLNQLLGYFDLQIIKKNQRIVGLSSLDEELIKLTSKYSMTPKIRIYTLLQSLKYIKNKKIDGDFVECGVWKGGNIILYKKILEEDFKNEGRSIYAYDTFEGMNTPTINDYDLLNKNSAIKIGNKEKKNSNFWGICSLEEVKNNILYNVKNLDHIKFIKGQVETTLNDKNNIPEKISILRLDTDWYKSTKKELDVLYNKVVPGGIIIIDDYGHWSGSKKAVDEFFKNQYVWMHYIDYACRLIIKD